MRKNGRTRHYIRYLSCVMAAVLGLLQPCAVMAVENHESEVSDYDDQESEDTLIYITAFESLAEEDAYFPCMYKPALEELVSVFPETLSVWTEGEEDSIELEVVWECEEDFDETSLERYVFYPKWDETQYVLADTEEDIEIPTITVEVPKNSGVIHDLEEASSDLQDIAQDKSILALVYLCDKYEVKDTPDQDGKTIHTVVSGQSVQITDVALDEYGAVWYQVILYLNEKEYTGYIEREYLATSDEEFARWEETYIDLSAIPMMMAMDAGYPDVDQFPASYQNALYSLKEKHPNWIFVRMDTGIDWNTAIAKEMGDKSLVPSSSSGSWQNGTYGQGWSYASEGILKYYMDPRNFLTDPAIFQFEQLTYNSSYHTTDAVQEVLKNSFMSSAIPGDSQTYAQAFTAIGEKTGVSPFHLASRVLQEQGKGTSQLISGKYSGYEGYYNYFNVGASGKTDKAVIESGLQKAKELGWDTRYKSLSGGASLIGVNYILKGQDTLYLEKFNVSNGKHANFTHQYMQNIQAPASEASNIRKAYNNAGALENSFVFKIPVYNNMPASACTKPNTTDTITLDKTTVSSLEVDKTITLIPYVNGSKVDYISNMTFSSNNTSVATVDNAGKVTAISPGSATISCNRSGANTATCTVTVVKANPKVSTPTLSPYTYQAGLRLSDVSLPDGWKWVKENTEIAVGTYSYEATYTPSDTEKYNTITKEISFTVTKAIPNCRMPEKLEAQAGSVVGDITLPDGFIWESNTEIELKEAGEYTLYVSYNPDENNYYTVEHIPLIVRVVGSAKPSDGDNTSAGSTSNGSTSSGSTTSTSTGTTSNGSTTSTGSTSSTSTGTTSNNSTSSDSTSTGSTGTTSKDSTTSTSAGTTSSGSTTSAGSTSNTSTTSSDSTTSTGSTTSTSIGTTSSGSTTSTSTGSTSTNTTSSDSTSNTSAGSTSNSSTTSTSSGSTTSAGSTSTGTTSNTSTSTNIDTTSNNKTSGNSAPTSTTSSDETSSNVSESNTSNSGAPLVSIPSSTAPAESTQNNSVAGSSAATQNTTTQTQVQSTPANNTTTAIGTEHGSTVIAPQTTVVEESQIQVQEEEEEVFFKPSVTIDMDDTTILTPEKLQMAKEQNFNLILDMGNYAKWSIDVDAVNVNAVTDVDMGITLSTKNIPTELIAAILNGNKYLEFTLAHEGEFGFSPVLCIALDPANCGRYANLFYYNPETESLEFICDTIIDINGVAEFKMEHASSYVIIVSDTSMSGVSISDDSVNPMIRWIIISVLICMIAVVIGCGIFFYRKSVQEADDDEDEEDEEAEDSEEEDEEVEDDIEIEEIKEIKAERKEPEKYFEKKQESSEEDDWIEDEDWHEPELSEKTPTDQFADDHAEEDWIDDDEWDSENDWMDDAEWEKKNFRK